MTDISSLQTSVFYLSSGDDIYIRIKSGDLIHRFKKTGHSFSVLCVLCMCLRDTLFEQSKTIILFEFPLLQTLQRRKPNLLQTRLLLIPFHQRNTHLMLASFFKLHQAHFVIFIDMRPILLVLHPSTFF